MVPTPKHHQVSRHALVKLTDAKGIDIGQGVLCLRDAFRSRPSWITSLDSSRDGGDITRSYLVAGTPGKERKARVCILLSHGGKAAGSIEVMLRMSKSDVSEHCHFPSNFTQQTMTKISNS